MGHHEVQLWARARLRHMSGRDEKGVVIGHCSVKTAFGKTRNNTWKYNEHGLITAAG